MQLILWRHAEAEDLAPRDLARNLTLKGHRQAEQHTSLTSQKSLKRPTRREVAHYPHADALHLLPELLPLPATPSDHTHSPETQPPAWFRA